MKLSIVFMITLIAVLVQNSTASSSIYHQEIGPYREQSPQYNYPIQYLSQPAPYLVGSYPRGPYPGTQYPPRPSYQSNSYQGSFYQRNPYYGLYYPRNIYHGSFYPQNPYRGLPETNALQVIGNRNPRYGSFKSTNSGGVKGHEGNNNGAQSDIVISVPSSVETQSTFQGDMSYDNQGGVTGHKGDNNDRQSGICIGFGCVRYANRPMTMLWNQ